MAPAKVLHGAVRLHGLASLPTPETQVRETSACAGSARQAARTEELVKRDDKISAAVPAILTLHAERVRFVAGMPVIPVALNSGLYWGRKAWAKKPGTILIEYLPPIPPGLDRKAFMAELEARLEPAAKRLLTGPA